MIKVMIDGTINHLRNGAKTITSVVLFRARVRCAGSLTYLSLPTYYLHLQTACMFRIRGFWGGDSLFWEEKHFQGGKSERTGPPPADGSDVAMPANKSIIIRAGQLASSSQSPYGRITVPSGSRLIFDEVGAEGDGSAANPIQMHTLGITVEGAPSLDCRTRHGGSVGCRLRHGKWAIPPRAPLRP